jgi:hypothetical protein
MIGKRSVSCPPWRPNEPEAPRERIAPDPNEPESATAEQTRDMPPTSHARTNPGHSGILTLAHARRATE